MEGTFDFVPSNNASASYPVDNFTDLGALYAASLDGGFGFNATDDYYSLYGSFTLKNITDVESSWTGGPTWFIFINGESASSGLGTNQIENGDYVTFWYCPYNSTTYEPITEQATCIVNIEVSIETDDDDNSGGSSGGTDRLTIVQNTDQQAQEGNDNETLDIKSDNSGKENSDNSEDNSADDADNTRVPSGETKETPTDTPGFGGILGVSGLLGATLYLMRKRE